MLTDQDFDTKIQTVAFLRIAADELDTLTHDRLTEAGLSKEKYEVWRTRSVAYLLVLNAIGQIEDEMGVNFNGTPNVCHDTEQFITRSLEMVKIFYAQALKEQDILMASAWDAARKVIKAALTDLETPSV